MRSYQIFASMSAEQATNLLQGLASKQPAAYAQAVAAAAAALKARPVYLQRQSAEKRAEAVRRALARVTGNAMAGEMLAVYFLDCRKALLVEWLDRLGLEHEDGTLMVDAPPPPPDADLRKAVDGFLSADEDPDRALLLAAFEAQDAIEWPVLEALLAPE
jgi:hypothetical protein